ncbi:metallophosphoesterase [Candidatus Saccharibacteria bacterium]|nr:metallophosphoesterase [Candidatus Saccharibacteria bacterium]
MSEFVVVTDLHGRLGHLKQIQARYPGVQLISGGDVVDGPEYSNVAETIELLLEMGAICLSGNHDWNLSAVLYENNPEYREAWLQIWQHNHLRTLESYGIEGLKTKEIIEARVKADHLRQKIESRGHDKYFQNLQPYFRFGKFIVVHAGLRNDVSIEEQLTKLDDAQTLAKWSDFSSAPDQIFDVDYYELSKSELVPSNESGTTLVTGHYHNKLTPEQRVTDNGRRVRLGTKYGDPKGPINVWESWSGNVVPIFPRS